MNTIYKTSLLLVLPLLAALSGGAQSSPTLIDGNVSVASGQVMEWYSNVEIAPTAKIYLQDGAKIIFYGQTLKVDPGAQIYGADATWSTFTQGSGLGSMTFQQPNPMDNSTVQQVLDGGNSGNPANATQNTFTSIVINNALGVKLANTDTRVGTNISFTNGHLYTDAKDMVLTTAATISNYDANKYVVTNLGNATGGHLVKENYTGAFTFPVGMADGDYTPATLTPSAANTVHVNVTDYASSTTVEGYTDGIQRTWNIYGNNTGAATVGLQHNLATEQVKFNNTSNFVTQYGTAPNNTGDAPSQSPWQVNTAVSTAPVAGTVVNSRAFTLATSGAANEAFFTKSSNIINPLPVVLQNFTAKAHDCNALVSWKTGSESLMDHYTVERSTDGKSFTATTQLAAKNTDGSDYSVLVPQQESSVMYRLNMVEKNGQQSYSQVAVVNTTCNSIDASNQVISAAPNPTRGMVTVNGLTQGQRVLVNDMAGHQLGAYPVSGNAITVDLGSYATGTYALSVIDATNHLVQTVKVVKAD